MSHHKSPDCRSGNEEHSVHNPAQWFAQWLQARAPRGPSRRSPPRLSLLALGMCTLVVTGVHGMADEGSIQLASLDSADPASRQLALSAAQTFEHQIRPLSTYCLSCHTAEKHKGDLDLSTATTGASALGRIAVWKQCATKLHDREMPPDKEQKQPTETEREALVGWVSSLKRLIPKDPGRSMMRRLSQAEYANTLHDLLGVDPKVADQLPQDVVGEGYNSTISPLLREKYLLVADAVLDQIIKPDQMSLSWKAGQLDAIIDRKMQTGKSDGVERRITGPGEVLAIVPAPVDGTYTVRVHAAAEKSSSKEPLRLALRIDNQVISEIKVTALPKSPATYMVTCKLPAGRSHLSLLMANPFIDNPPPANAAATKGGAVASPPTAAKVPAKPAGQDAQEMRTVVIEAIVVVGPPAAAASEAQRRLIIATPGKDFGRRDAAKLIAANFARRAYRRPPAADEIDTLLRVFDLADGQDEVFSESVKLMLKAVLVSPAFLYLTPDDGTATGSDMIVPLGDHQLASRLSYLFWSTMPDDELAALADAGSLHNPVVLEKQVRRLIADPRSRALFSGFGAPWLWLDRLDELPVDEKRFSFMTKDLRHSMYEECALLFDTILHENRSIVDFVDCDYTFMNGPLAKLYGMEATVKGPQMVRVHLIDANRGGVLTMPGVLAVTSLPTRTSPVKRGRWVLEQILGQNPPPPPMNVPPLEQQNTASNAGLNLRQRTERHRSDPACAACHRTLDPIGFGLENFDAVGRWRDMDDVGVAVDAAGELPGNQTFHRPAELKHLIAAHVDDLCHTLVTKILAYTLCRHLDGYDEVVADDIAATVAKDGYRFQTLWLAVATSYPVLNRHLGH